MIKAPNYGTVPGTAYGTGTIMEPVAVPPGGYAAPTTVYGAPPTAYAAPGATYAAPATTYGAAPTYAAPATTFAAPETMYAAPTYAAPAAGATYAAPMGAEVPAMDAPTYAAPAEPVFAQGPAATYTTEPQQGMGSMLPPQPKQLPTETVMGPVTQADACFALVRFHKT